MKLYQYPSALAEKRILEIIGRGFGFKKKDIRYVEQILEDVRKNGDAALLRYIHKFDSKKITKNTIRVSQKEFKAAAKQTDRKFMYALNIAAKQIESFHRHQIQRSWITADRPGTLLGQIVNPVDSAGIYVPGHTEYLAELTGTTNFGMMLIGGGLRVMLVTRHIPLSDVSCALNRRNIREHIELTGEALKLFGIKKGKIGVCGLNPHAGDGGVIGREEIRLINPAVKAARSKGYHVSDAVPADTIFYEALNGKYDAVVAMYHDQGLAPLKMIGFDEGINVTLGLPIIRTSPDHGTAFGIAGSNQASSGSMQKAIALAIRMAGMKNPWK